MLVIPTNEELAIARACVQVISYECERAKVPDTPQFWGPLRLLARSQKVDVGRTLLARSTSA